MKKTKKVLVTVATSEIIVVRRNGQKPMLGFCQTCATKTAMLDLNSAATHYGIGARDLIRQIETGAIHALETNTGHLYVCGNLPQAISKKTTRNSIENKGDRK